MVNKKRPRSPSEERRAKDRKRKKKAMAEETPEQAEIRKQKNRERMAAKRKRETEEQRNIREVRLARRHHRIERATIIQAENWAEYLGVEVLPNLKFDTETN
ncbi:hypothetical protein Bbelb_380600 [Branchiostoma belcheri]|nr:hypothetical protein Bbelb_380600 [Branchiostoma belcheri]